MLPGDGMVRKWIHALQKKLSQDDTLALAQLDPYSPSDLTCVLPRLTADAYLLQR